MAFSQKTEELIAITNDNIVTLYTKKIEMLMPSRSFGITLIVFLEKLG